MKYSAILLALGFLTLLSPMRLPAASLTGITICVDPGHPSETSAGTASRDGKTTENHIDWVVALRLKKLLIAEGATVVLTKTSEHQMVTNRNRAEMANAAHAQLFLRLHCDSAADSGLGTYYPNRPGFAHGRRGPSAEMIAASYKAGLVFHPAVIAALRGKLLDRGLRGESETAIGAKQGALTGSIFSVVPSLTVEMCVLTNSHDTAFVKTARGQDAIAQALLTGVNALFQAAPTSHQ